MILDSLIKLEAVLGASVSANQPEVHVVYRDWLQNDPTRPSMFRVALNGNTDVTILAATTLNYVREVLRVFIYNKDTAAVTCTVKTDNGTTEFIIVKETLAVGQTLMYEPQHGWSLSDVASTWTAFTPARTGWTDVGSPTVTGRYSQVGRLVFSQVKVVPSTSIATTFGTSYIAFPVAAGTSALAGDGSFQNQTSLAAASDCVIDNVNSRCYVPTQVASGNTFTIAWWYEV